MDISKQTESTVLYSIEKGWYNGVIKKLPLFTLVKAQYFILAVEFLNGISPRNLTLYFHT
uniref:Uncharacterized protein n=1 Tax=Anguilla anguilla TaxID=7936 RepID=A0A0E9X2V0_ANGAN